MRRGERSRQRVWRRTPPTLLLAALATVAGWPFLSTTPPGALDDGYFYVLNQWLFGRLGGRAVVFPYGPLGTLSHPYAWSRPMLAVQLLFAAGVLGGLAWMVVRRLRRALPWPLATVVAGVVVVTGAVSGLVEPAALIAALVALEVWEGRLPAAVVVPALFAGVVVLVLLRPTTAVLALLAGALVVLTGAPTWPAGLERVVLACLVTTLGTLLVWLALGLPVGQIPNWLRGLAEYASGYDVESLEEAGRAWEYVAAAVLSVLVLALAARSRPHRVAALVLVSAVLYVDAKHGFVRHDAHSVAFFSTAVVLLVGLLRPEDRAYRFALAPASVILALVAGGAAPGIAHPLGGARALVHQVATVADGGRWNAQRRHDIAVLRARFRVPQTLLDVVGSSPVDVEPWEGAVAFAYGLNLAPVPVVQPYTSFTGWLDDLTARSLAGSSAARYVLRHTTLGSLDGRYPLADSAAYQVELACRYREVGRDGEWQLVERGPNRCGPAQPLATVVLRPGEAVPVPAASPGSLVTARITPAYDVGFRLRAAFLKTTRWPQLVLDGTAYRFLWTAPGGPIPVRAPESMALLDPLPGGRPDVHRLELRRVPGPVVVEFEQRAVGAP